MNRILISLVLICTLQFGYSQCTDNILINGSFNGMVGELVTANGWEFTSTPDLNDASGVLNTTPGYEWTGIVLPSPNGGTWQNIFGIETISQAVELVVGTEYELCLEYAAQGIAAGTLIFDQPVGVNISVNGDTLVSTLDMTQYTWEQVCISFTATQTTNEITISTTNQQYVGIDGACLTGLEEEDEIDECVIETNSITSFTRITRTDESLFNIQFYTDELIFNSVQVSAEDLSETLEAFLLFSEAINLNYQSAIAAISSVTNSLSKNHKGDSPVFLEEAVEIDEILKKSNIDIQLLNVSKFSTQRLLNTINNLRVGTSFAIRN